MIDNHIHFTGSLPKHFLWERLKSNANRVTDQETSEALLGVELSTFLEKSTVERDGFYTAFFANLKNYFADNFESNIKKFFTLYCFVQSFTKPLREDESKYLYEKGTYLIAKENQEEGVKRFEIIAGISKDIDSTFNRFGNMVNGLLQAENENKHSSIGSLRVTFIRNETGSFKNYSDATFSNFLSKLESDKLIEKKISGFDFSGEENKINFVLVRKIVREITEYNKYRASKGKKELTISIHAGENLSNVCIKDQLSKFYDIIDIGINKIAHGTFLWTSGKLLNLTTDEETLRQDLLRVISNSNMELEICPTANIYLSPNQIRESIDLSLLNKYQIKYSLNSDNKTLFSTNIWIEASKIKQW